MSGRRAKQKRKNLRQLPKATPPIGPKPLTALIRGGRVGRADLNARVPWVAALADKSVALFGCGSLGAPAALELARCGLANLRVLDGDVLDPATISRWPVGVSFAGYPKVGAIHSAIASNWPWTEVHTEFRHLGRIREADAEPDGAVVSRMLDGIDLVIDATAEYGVSYLLSELAWERRVPYLSMTAEHGAWGGTILAIRPGNAGCWMCYQAGVGDGSIPRPPSDPAGITQPDGCAAPTFTGASFDLQPIVAQGVRTAVSLLTLNADGGYPKLSWDVAVGSLRDAAGLAIAPTWHTQRLSPHPNCPRGH